MSLFETSANRSDRLARIARRDEERARTIADAYLQAARRDQTPLADATALAWGRKQVAADRRFNRLVSIGLLLALIAFAFAL